MSTRTKIILGAAVLLGSFLLGFIPQILENWRLQGEIARLQSEVSVAQRQAEIDALRNLAGRMLLEALQKNYGVAQELSTSYFDKTQKLEAEADNPALMAPLSQLLADRDAITAALTQGSPSVVPDLQSLLRRTNDLPDPTVVGK